MTNHEKELIREYLVAYKIPIEVFQEVENHFIEQTEEYKFKENLSFENAFEKTKNAWKVEFKLVKNLWISDLPLPAIAIKLFKAQFVPCLKQGFFAGLIIFILPFLLHFFVQNLNLDFYKWYFEGTFFTIGILVVFIFLRNYNFYRKLKNNTKIPFLNKHFLANLSFCSVMLFQIFYNIKGFSEEWFNFFENKNYDFWSVSLFIVFPIIIFSFSITSLLFYFRNVSKIKTGLYIYS
jgi:hypothetical protein